MVVGTMEFFNDFGFLHHTSAYAGYTTGVLLVGIFKLAQYAEEMLVGIFSYAAGIQYAYVGLFEIVFVYVTKLFQHARKSFRISFVHLAAEGHDVICLRHATDPFRFFP